MKLSLEMNLKKNGIRFECNPQEILDLIYWNNS